MMIKEDAENFKDVSLKEYSFLFGIFFIISIVFFVSLSMVDPPVFSGTGEVVLSPGEDENFDFGIGEILFSLAFGLLMMGFLIWIRSTSVKNPYMGAILGILGTAIIAYGFSLRFRGVYSTGFMIATGMVVLGYLGRNFWKFRKGDKYIVGEFDEG